MLLSADESIHLSLAAGNYWWDFCVDDTTKSHNAAHKAIEAYEKFVDAAPKGGRHYGAVFVGTHFCALVQMAN